jgi:protein SCO1
MRHFIGAAGLSICLLSPDPSLALSSSDLRNVEVSLPAGAEVPSLMTGHDLQGAERRLRDIVDRPSVLIFADYTCETLCGPVLSFVAAALDASGLRPAADFKLIVIGLDPKDGLDAARQMQRAQIGDDPPLLAATTFLTADAEQVKLATAALGYRYVYDAGNDQFAHPAAAFVLTANGRVSRVLSGLGLNGDDMRLALVEAANGSIGSFSDQIHLLCYGFDPTQGTYNLAVSRLLIATGIATTATLTGLIGLLIVLGQRRQA